MPPRETSQWELGSLAAGGARQPRPAGSLLASLPSCHIASSANMDSKMGVEATTRLPKQPPQTINSAAAPTPELRSATELGCRWSLGGRQDVGEARGEGGAGGRAGGGAEHERSQAVEAGGGVPGERGPEAPVLVQ